MDLTENNVENSGAHPWLEKNGAFAPRPDGDRRGLLDPAARELEPFLSRQVPQHIADADRERLRRRSSGRHMLQLRRGAVAIDLGARSGLEALQIAMRDPTATVVAVEPKPVLYAALEDTTRENKVTNIHLFHTADAALEFVGSRTSSLDYAKVEQRLFSPALLAALGRFRIGHLAGRFDHSQADPVEVYRFSRRHATTFWWTRPNGLPPVSGRGRPGPDVSIVVPVYGVVQYLPQCLESLVNQTIASKEIIVVDDGSIDGSGAVADEWATRFPCIRVIHKVNGGAASARSAGRHLAQGEFIGFVDGDDWVDVDMFEDLYRDAVTDNSDIAQCEFVTVDMHGSPIEQSAGHVVRGVISQPRDLLVLQPTIWRRLYRKQFLDAHKLDFDPGLKYFEDLPFQFEALAAASRVSVTPKAHYYYRLGRADQQVSIRDERMYVHFDIFRRLRTVVAVYGLASVETRLRQVEINTHLWALQRLTPRLRPAYAWRAAVDIVRHKLMLRFPAKLRIAIGKSVAFALVLLIAFAACGWRRSDEPPRGAS